MEIFTFSITARDDATAHRQTTDFSDFVGGIDGVTKVVRRKHDTDSMDIGTVIEVIAESGTARAIAQGLFKWLAPRKRVDIQVKVEGRQKSIAVAAKGLDSKTAVDVIRLILEDAAGSN